MVTICRIKKSKDTHASRARGEDSGLSDDEIAFYNALAENSSAFQIMGNDQLKLIAHKLLESLKANVSIDRAHRENARVRLRVLVKRILKKYEYPRICKIRQHKQYCNKLKL